MSHLFISYSRQDERWLSSLASFLDEVGTSYFIDLDAQSGIPVGRYWERELYRQLRRADAVLALVSCAQRDSQWCFAELAIARSIGKAIVPLTIDGCAPHPLLGDLQHISAEDLDSSALRDRVLHELRRIAPLREMRDFSFDFNRPPYPGLQPYAEADEAIFFGRETETREILDMVSSNVIIAGEYQALTITGPSGSGKSSLIRAGILPNLQRDQKRWPLILRAVPGDNPGLNLAHVLSASATPAQMGADTLGRKFLERSDFLRETATEFLAKDASTTSGHVVLFLDQFEEVYTLCDESTRQDFFELIKRSTTKGSPIFVLIALRSAYLDRIIEDAPWLCESTKVVLQLDRTRLPSVIQGPAKLVGMEFAPGLVERMVADTEGGDALPMLNFTLNQLFGMVGSDRICDQQAYDSLDGVVGALRRQADSVQASLESQGSGGLVVPTLLRLADVNHKGEPVRRRLRLSGLSNQEKDIVSAFVNARLLRTDGDGQDATVEVAHEALLRQWPPLRRAIERSQDRMATLARLYQLADHWEASGGHPSYLQVGPVLRRSLELVSGTNPTELVDTYLKASVAYAAPPFWRRGVSVVTDFFVASTLVGIIFTAIRPWIDFDFGAYLIIVLSIPMFFLVRTIGFRYGATPGMHLTGLAISGRYGTRLRWYQAIARALILMIPYRDRICGTIVVSRFAG